MTKLADIPVNNIPNGEDVWNGIGNFRTLSQVIYEFMDDSISNLRGNAENPLLDRRIRTCLEHCKDYVDITITDGGTVVNFHCPWAMFTTLNAKEKNSRKKRVSFPDLVAILEEDLRYTYSAILMAGNAEIEVSALDTDSEKPVVHTLKPLTPVWVDGTMVELPPAHIKLDEVNPVLVPCRYGLIENHPEARFRYKRNSRTAGAEISIQGRVVESGILTDIWGANAHNSHNGFLVQVNLDAENGDFLPPTQSAKTEFRRSALQLPSRNVAGGRDPCPL